MKPLPCASPNLCWRLVPACFRKFTNLWNWSIRRGLSTGQRSHVEFTTVNAEMAWVDVDNSKDSAAKAWRLSGGDSAFFREWLNTQSSEKRLSLCKGIIKQKLSKMNCVNDRELDEYIDRVLGTMSENQLSELE